MNVSVRISFIASLAFCSLAGLAQTPQSQPAIPKTLHSLYSSQSRVWTDAQLATMAKIRDAAMKDPYPLTELRHLTDNIGPRLSGSPQAQKAVEYVAEEMRALGAEVTLEKATVPHWVRGEETAQLTSWPGQASGTTQKIVLTALGGSVATPPSGIEAQVVVVNSFAELKALPENAVRGKILLFNEHFDKQLAAQNQGIEAYGQAVVYRGNGPTVAANHGAIAVLIRSVGGADYRLPHTGLTQYSSETPKIPAAAVTAEDADLLANLSSQGPVTLHLTLTPQTLPPVESYNVIADWKGSEHPEDVVIVSGHLDSWDLGTGAIDDGAGVTTAMQTIHLMKQLGIRARRTIRFIAWMAEEEGSQGAESYARDHSAELSHHVGAIESDLGAGHPTGILFAGKPELAAWLRPVSDLLEPIGASTLIPGQDTGEDINFLTTQGVPTFAPNQDSRFYFNYHHTAADTFDKVDPQELKENATVISVLAYALADAP
jgi:carboxypeptidase Q